MFSFIWNVSSNSWRSIFDLSGVVKFFWYRIGRPFHLATFIPSVISFKFVLVDFYENLSEKVTFSTPPQHQFMRKCKAWRISTRSTYNALIWRIFLCRRCLCIWRPYLHISIPQNGSHWNDSIKKRAQFFHDQIFFLNFSTSFVTLSNSVTLFACLRTSAFIKFSSIPFFAKFSDFVLYIRISSFTIYYKIGTSVL